MSNPRNYNYHSENSTHSSSSSSSSSHSNRSNSQYRPRNPENNNYSKPTSNHTSSTGQHAWRGSTSSRNYSTQHNHPHSQYNSTTATHNSKYNSKSKPYDNPRHKIAQNCYFPKSDRKLPKFRVISYNILADELLHKFLELYINTKYHSNAPHWLLWSHRLPLLISQLTNSKQFSLPKSKNQSRNHNYHNKNHLHSVNNNNNNNNNNNKKEVEELNADVICLQEVDHFEELREIMKGFQYEGVFKKRTDLKKNDGCAIFYRSDLFDLIELHEIELNRVKSNRQLLSDVNLNFYQSLYSLVTPFSNSYNHNNNNNKNNKNYYYNQNENENKEMSEESNENEEEKEEEENNKGENESDSEGESGEESKVEKTILDRDNVAITVLLQRKNSGKIIAVTTTHLLYNPKRGDIKMAQIHLLFNEVHSIVQRMREVLRNRSNESQNRSNLKIPIIICGDFNTLPNSGVYQFVRHSKLEIDVQSQPYWAQELSGQFKLKSYHENRQNESIGAKKLLVEHPLKLKSAYAEHYSSEPLSTTIHRRARSTVDYIWYSYDDDDDVDDRDLSDDCDRFVLSEVMELERDTCLNLQLPSKLHPSDHLFLAAEFSGF